MNRNDDLDELDVATRMTEPAAHGARPPHARAPHPHGAPHAPIDQGGLAPSPAPGLGRRNRLVPFAISGAVAVVILSGAALYRRASARTNDVALSSAPKPVTVVEAKATKFRATRRYVATVEPWLEARIGPELTSGYVDSVAFRPGATVKKGDVVATLDCRSVSAQAESAAMTAKALEAKQAAIAKESDRLKSLLDKGFVSENEADKKLAESESQAADLLSSKAKLLGTSLAVDDCVLKAPFDGEVASRSADPGAFVRPGATIVSLVQRDMVRISADVPEIEQDLVAPGTLLHVRLLATDRTIDAPVARRSPGADSTLRLIHVEADVPNSDRSIPVGTTADLTVGVGDTLDAAELPLTAVSIRGNKATVFLVEDGVAKKISVKLLGETGGSVFLDPSIAGKQVVVEGRALLSDKDHVAATTEEAPPAPSASASAAVEKPAVSAAPSAAAPSASSSASPAAPSAAPRKDR